MDRASTTRITLPQCRWLACLGLCAAQALVGQRARAQEVTFDEALALSAQTPEVLGAKGELSVREAADEGIGGTAGPTSLTFMPGALVAPRQANAFELQTNITQGWNLGGLGKARRESAVQEREALDAAVRAKALRARLEAARRWIDLATLERIQETIEQRIKATEKLVAQRERALETGVGTAQALAESRAALAELRQMRVNVEGDQVSASSQLALAMGRAPGAKRLRAVGELPGPPLPSEAEIRSRLDSVDTVPDVVVERLREIAARARAVEASALYAPVIDFGAQAERAAVGSRGAWVVYGMTGVTFHGFGQNQRAVSLAEADAAIASANIASARLRARAEIEQALHELAHSSAIVNLLETQTIPALQTLVATRARAVELGEESSFALSEARGRELATIEVAYRGYGAQSWARVHVWLLLAELAGAEEDR